MQTIARANRVAPNKSCGLIVDYVNVFKYMQKALGQYAISDDVEMPVKDIDNLISMLDSTISESSNFLFDIGIDLENLIGDMPVFERLEELRNAYDTILSKDANVDKFKVLMNTMDAFAFTKYIMKEWFDIDVIFPNLDYDSVLEMYIEKYFR